MALTTCRECKGQVAQDAPACPHCGTSKPGRKPTSVGNILVGIIGVLIVATCIGSISDNKSPPASAPAPAPAAAAATGKPSTPASAPTAATKSAPSAKDKAAAEQRFNVCKKKLIQAQKLEVLYDMDWKPPRSPKVVAGPTFMSMPIDAKEGFAETVNCFLMAGSTDHINFDILHWQTGKVVGRYSWGSFEME